MTYVKSLRKQFEYYFVYAERGYRRVFSVGEIEHSKILKSFFGVSLFAFFITFSQWISQSFITVQTATNGGALCWSYFPTCSKLYFLQALPYGYSQPTFYMGLYALILFAVYCMWRGKWTSAHASLLLLFLWKVLVMFVLTEAVPGGVNYYHLLLTAAFLFLPYKEFFLSVSFVLAYFIAVIVKIDETWLLGTYFTSLQTGLPIFGNSFAPLFTNFVVCMQVVGSWFLLSRHRLLQRAALIFFIVFHVYSGVLVGYAFPAFVLPCLIILFGPLYKPFVSPISKRAWIGWIYILLLFIFAIPGHLIVGDQRLTQEGNRFGLNLFDANHQCVETLTTYSKTSTPITPTETKARKGTACEGYICLTDSKDSMQNGLTVHEERWESPVAWQRCNPYRYFVSAKNACNDPDTVRVSMQFDHSIDGGPFYRIVNEQNICNLTYNTFTHNDWIKLPPEAPIVGYPVKNEFRYIGQYPAPQSQNAYVATSSKDLIVLNELVGNDPIELTPLQTLLTPYLYALIWFWRFAWVSALLAGIYTVWKYRERSHS